jgi:pyridoxal phosphate enzyme (YggS family)
VSEVAIATARVRAEIAAAARRAGRDPASVALIAVSKRQPDERIAAAIAAGLTDFGENYVQELLAKQARIAGADRVKWHFIGRLQTNKIKQLVGQVALVHAVDDVRQLDELDRRARAAGVVQAALLAVNLGGEASKTGVAPATARELVAYAAGLPGVALRGLMTMPPLVDDPELSRPVFRALRELRDELAGPALALPELSMGTTSDFAVAVEEGATLVRVGTAVFGARPS